jgi:hypothetical protein
MNRINLRRRNEHVRGRREVYPRRPQYERMEITARQSLPPCAPANLKPIRVLRCVAHQSLGHSAQDATGRTRAPSKETWANRPSITSAYLIGDLRACVANAIRETVSGP